MIKEKKTKRLFWQLFPTYLFISVISVIAVSWYASSALREFFLKQTQIDLQARGHLLKRQIGAHLKPLDARSIDFICKEIGSITGTRFTVILPNGEVVGDTDENPQRMDNHRSRPEVLQALKNGSGRSTRYSGTLHQNMMYVAIPIKKDNTVAAVIRASLSISAIDETLRQVNIRIAWGGFIMILFAALFSYISSRYIGRPIEQIRKGAERFAAGDLKYRLPSMTTQELSSLSAALNDMAVQLEEKMKSFIRQRNELEAVLASMVEGVLAVDKDERIRSANRAAAHMFECQPEALQGRLIQEVVRNRDLQEFVKKALAGGTHIEKDLSFYKNNERVINAYSSPLRDATGMQVGTLMVLNDVTKVRRLENIRRDFVANVSHEIKTPLTAIKGFVETLQQGAVDNAEDSERFLDIIAKHVERLNAIVDDLLCLSRIEAESEKEEIKLEETSIREVLDPAVQACQTKAHEKNISIVLACEQEEMTARIDPPLFEQAAVNLIDNAVKYSPEGSTVTVSCEKADASEIAIHFTDCGIGIPTQHLDRIFERFYRVDKARSRSLGGTGLGLAIVKHIVQAHGGRITVESTPGAGSTFSIYLPIE
ncbi:MAG: two-component system histidine kinase PnpS [Thermodesulfobacteriota bacterium]